MRFFQRLREAVASERRAGVALGTGWSWRFSHGARGAGRLCRLCTGHMQHSCARVLVVVKLRYKVYLQESL